MMSGGRRKSRKPQKWEDFVDDEQLKNIEKEMENEEKERMIVNEEKKSQMIVDEEKKSQMIASLMDMIKDKEEEEEDGKSPTQEPSEGDEDDGEMSDGSLKLEIVMKEEHEELTEEQLLPKQDFMNKDSNTNNSSQKEQEELNIKENSDKHTRINNASEKKTANKNDKKTSNRKNANKVNDIVIGECKKCGIELCNWKRAHNHIQYHRLHHVPQCSYKETSQPANNFKKNCVYCSRSCQSSEVLAYHAFTEHFPLKPHHSVKTPNCPFCNTSFSNIDELHTHLDFDFIVFICQLCGMCINEEHKLYKHLEQCLRKEHPGVISLPCSICKGMISLDKLTIHLLNHSSLVNLAISSANNNKKKRSRQKTEDLLVQTASSSRPFLCEFCDRKFVLYAEFKRHLYSHSKLRCYICDHCGRTYCQKNSLIVHLFQYHNETPNTSDITPKDHVQQRSCELCGRVGFVNIDLLIRHLIVRCHKRNTLQTSFASIIEAKAKEASQEFLETMYSDSMKPYMKRGMEAWPTPSYVHNFLQYMLCDPAPNPPPPLTRKEAAEFTDIQLLTYLSKFEDSHRKKDKELDFLLTAKKDGNNQELERMSPENRDTEMTETPTGTPNPKPTSVPTTPKTSDNPSERGGAGRVGCMLSEATQANLNSLVQHLRKGGDKRRAEEGEGGPIDICLVTSSTNTQVTITPAGHTSQTLHPPKIARNLPQRPSLSEIKKRYPGVRVLSDVDFSRLPSLLLQMMHNIPGRVQKEIESRGISASHLQRLEFEAQLLREAEPFYLIDSNIYSSHTDTPNTTTSNNASTSTSNNASTSTSNASTALSSNITNGVPSPSVLSRIVAEMGMFAENNGNNTDCVPSDEIIKRLWKEAKEIDYS